jgi:transposase
VLQRKAQLFYLPPYSPDMSPIYRAFSKFEAALRVEPARTVDTLWRRCGIILNSFLTGRLRLLFSQRQDTNTQYENTLGSP